jgi:hypothetical protein
MLTLKIWSPAETELSGRIWSTIQRRAESQFPNGWFGEVWSQFPGQAPRLITSGTSGEVESAMESYLPLSPNERQSWVRRRETRTIVQEQA